MNLLTITPQMMGSIYNLHYKFTLTTFHYNNFIRVRLTCRLSNSSFLNLSNKSADLL